MGRSTRRLWVRGASRVAVLGCGCLLVACLPARRSADAAADTTIVDVSVAGDALNSETSGAGDAEIDAAAQDSGQQDTALADVPIPVGCASDSACAALVTNPCHVPTCDLASGLCVVMDLPDGATCGVDNKCLSEESCKAGACVGVAVDCDDGDVCTTNTCNKLSGCVDSFNEATCDDGDACTQNDKCSQGKCTASPRQCIPAGGPCAKTACVSAKGGCVLIPLKLAKGKTCDDGQPCTIKDDCVAGQCVGTPMVCPADGNPCTANACAVKNGKGLCQVTGVGLVVCDDKNPCTEMDRCEPTKNNPDVYTCAGSAKSCDDKKPCTNDACKDGKCEHKANDAATCSDDDTCTVGDTCKAGICVKGKTKNCDDGNLCSNDSCDAKLGGCVHVSNTAKCSDGDVCTHSDACATSICSGIKTTCDDGNPCTADTCVSGVGCVASSVKNGTTCAGGGQCWGGGCVVAKCGNTICEFNEDAKTCGGDCPIGGGLCKTSDTSCLAGCRTTRCAAPVKACANEKPCPVMLTCLDKCTNDGCRLGCAKAASAKAVTAYYALTYCLSTKCAQNNWDGKQCKTSASAYPACIKACQTGVCTGEEIACFGSSTCANMAKCVDACPLSDNTCPVKCIKAGDAAAAKTYDTLSLCVQAKCL